MKWLKLFLAFHSKGVFFPEYQERTDGVKDMVDKHPTKIGGFNGHKSMASKDSK